MSQSLTTTLELFNRLQACYQKVNMLIIKNQAISAADVDAFQVMLHQRDDLRAQINVIIDKANLASAETVARASLALEEITQQIGQTADKVDEIADGVKLVQQIAGAVATAAAILA